MLLNDIHFSELDYITISLNLLTLLASPLLIKWSAHDRTPKELSQRVTSLRVINLLILLVYCLAVVYDFRLGQTFAQISLTVMLSFAVNHVVQMWVLARFGTVREVSGAKVLARSHTSSMIGLLLLVLIIALTFVAQASALGPAVLAFASTQLL